MTKTERLPVPIAADDVWEAVMTAAGYQCQCEGRCGTKHAKNDGRCPRTHTYRDRLLAAQREPDGEFRARALPTGELRAWCPRCYDGAVRARRREVRDRPPQEEALF